MKTSLNFILLNWKTARLLTTFYLKKVFYEFCYECIKINKTEQDWSSNQFAVHASEYSA